MNFASKLKREWCAMLAKLTSPMDPATATAAFVDMLSVLYFPDQAFNRETLEAAARRAQGDTAVPNFDKISRALGEWTSARRPVAQRLGANPDTVRVGHEPPGSDHPAEKARVGECLVLLAAEIKREISKNLPESAAPKAHHLSKLQLARSASARVLALRPDLREVLEMAEMRQ
jgi:hypothetical protein